MHTVYLRMCFCVYIDAHSCVLCVLMQTAGLAGAQAELCAVCHGERRQQGHVLQERSGQRAQQQQVTLDLTRGTCFNVPSVQLSIMRVCSGPCCWNKTPVMFVYSCLCCALVHVRVESSIVKVATDLDAAASQPNLDHKAVSKVKQKARAFLQEMVANISPAFIRSVLYTRNLTPLAFQALIDCFSHFSFCSG